MKNKKILVLGCSYSKWGDRPSDSGATLSWPKLLANKLPDWQIYNAAMYSNSTAFQLYELSIYVHWDFDLIIWQLPPKYRATYFLIKGTDTFRSNLFKDFKNTNYTTYDDSKYHDSVYHSPMRGVNKNIFYKMDSFRDKHCISRRTGIYDYANVNYGVQILKANDAHYLIFDHIAAYPRSPLCDDIHFCTADEFNTELTEFQADTSGHFNDKGYRALVNRLILPRISKYVHVQ